ncbi:MAG: hypothetical protein AAF367_13205 [Pseudomonadota bacterium]
MIVWRDNDPGVSNTDNINGGGSEDVILGVRREVASGPQAIGEAFVISGTCAIIKRR